MKRSWPKTPRSAIRFRRPGGRRCCRARQKPPAEQPAVAALLPRTAAPIVPRPPRGRPPAAACRARAVRPLKALVRRDNGASCPSRAKRPPAAAPNGTDARATSQPAANAAIAAVAAARGRDRRPERHGKGARPRRGARTNARWHCENAAATSHAASRGARNRAARTAPGASHGAKNRAATSSAAWSRKSRRAA